MDRNQFDLDNKNQNSNFWYKIENNKNSIT